MEHRNNIVKENHNALNDFTAEERDEIVRFLTPILKPELNSIYNISNTTGGAESISGRNSFNDVEKNHVLLTPLVSPILKPTIGEDVVAAQLLEQNIISNELDRISRANSEANIETSDNPIYFNAQTGLYSDVTKVINRTANKKAAEILTSFKYAIQPLPEINEAEEMAGTQGAEAVKKVVSKGRPKKKSINVDGGSRSSSSSRSSSRSSSGSGLGLEPGLNSGLGLNSGYSGLTGGAADHGLAPITPAVLLNIKSRSGKRRVSDLTKKERSTTVGGDINKINAKKTLGNMRPVDTVGTGSDAVLQQQNNNKTNGIETSGMNQQNILESWVTQSAPPGQFMHFMAPPQLQITNSALQVNDQDINNSLFLRINRDQNSYNNENIFSSHFSTFNTNISSEASLSTSTSTSTSSNSNPNSNTSTSSTKKTVSERQDSINTHDTNDQLQFTSDRNKRQRTENPLSMSSSISRSSKSGGESLGDPSSVLGRNLCAEDLLESLADKPTLSSDIHSNGKTPTELMKYNEYQKPEAAFPTQQAQNVNKHDFQGSMLSGQQSEYATLRKENEAKANREKIFALLGATPQQKLYRPTNSVSLYNQVLGSMSELLKPTQSLSPILVPSFNLPNALDDTQLSLNVMNYSSSKNSYYSAEDSFFKKNYSHGSSSTAPNSFSATTNLNNSAPLVGLGTSAINFKEIGSVNVTPNTLHNALESSHTQLYPDTKQPDTLEPTTASLLAPTSCPSHLPRSPKPGSKLNVSTLIGKPNLKPRVKSSFDSKSSSIHTGSKPKINSNSKKKPSASDKKPTPSPYTTPSSSPSSTTSPLAAIPNGINSVSDIIENLSTKSNYQNIIEGNSDKLGLTYPEDLQISLESRRNIHKVAEQRRRDIQRDALNKLKAVIPIENFKESRPKSLSKVHVLNIAADYISLLKSMVEEKDAELAKLKAELSSHKS